MTAYRFVTLTCDGCGEIWDQGCARSVAEARGSARGEGWVRDGRRGDLCGVCAGTHVVTAGGHLLLRLPKQEATT